MSVRRITNLIRRGAAMSLLIHGEVRKSLDTPGVVGEAMSRQPTWLETERQEGVGGVSGETCVVGGERRRSQSLHSSAAGKAARGAESKAAPREGR